MKAWSLFVAGALVVAGCRHARPVTVQPPPASASPTTAVDHAALLSAQGADAVLWQHASAEYHRLAVQGYELARIRLAENLRSPDPRPKAVIVDIDETVLDNSPYQLETVATGRTFDQVTWKTWTDKASAKATPGALAFLLHVRDQGCEVFYITNRDIRERASTLKNLQDLGFPNADEAHLLLMDGTSDKTERRARVAATHRIVLLVGDQLRDFDERFKDRSVNYGKDLVDAMADTLSRYFILLPNPMYGTYRDAVHGKGTDAEKYARMKAWFEQQRR
jgi:5'-nucleotidase (lipoprotein e(P4) family)